MTSSTFIAPTSIVSVLVAAYAIFWKIVPQIDESVLVSNIPTELKGQTFHWRYDVVGWDLRVLMGEDGTVYWEGLEEPFRGTMATVHPHFTKIRDHMYFITCWQIPIGFDLIVVDLEEDHVYAHSKANSKFASISGYVYCNSLKEQSCEPPKKK